MSVGTLAPVLKPTIVDANGNPLSGALINAYTAGTLTRATTYSDASLLVPNTNPLVCDSAGRYVMFLAPGTYDFVVTTSVGVVQYSVPGVVALQGASSVNLDITGTFGENVTANDPVYLSDGSGGLTQGKWYRTDADFDYASTSPVVGFVVTTTASGQPGTIRLGGSMSGFSALVPGTPYFLSGTVGQITSTSPAKSRFIGVADSTTSLVIAVGPRAADITGLFGDAIGGRLTLTTALPVTTADVTAATTVFYTPYASDKISLYDGTTTWNQRTFAELSIAVPATTATMYDVFVYDNSGTPALELLAWTNDTTRATALVRQNGRLCKTGALTRRYVGTFRTTGVSGQTEDSYAKRYLYNYYNRAMRPIRGAIESTDSWTYTLAALRQANANTANQVDVVVGVAEDPIDVRVNGMFSNAGGSKDATVAIGEDSTTTRATGCLSSYVKTGSAGDFQSTTATLVTIPAVGRHFYTWLESAQAVSTTTWYGDNGSPATIVIQSGISGMWRN